jgi:transcriptional regulator with XRE-family HTH domain
MRSAWRQQLRAAREDRQISQRQLAELVGLSTESVRAYESGRRTPDREHLVRLLDGLKLEISQRDSILEGAGFVAEGSPHLADPDFYFTLEQALKEVQQHPWPAFVNNEWSEVVVANEVAQQLWGVDLRHEYTDPIDRNLLSVASTPQFAERVANWDEAVGVLVAVWKGHHRGAEDLDAPSPYFASVMQRFLNGDPQYVARFLTLWQNVQPRTPKVRWWYPIVWNEPGVGVMRFRCFAGDADETNGLAFNDWIPLDSESWVALERVKKLRR